MDSINKIDRNHRFNGTYGLETSKSSYNSKINDLNSKYTVNAGGEWESSFHQILNRTKQNIQRVNERYGTNSYSNTLYSNPNVNSIFNDENIKVNTLKQAPVEKYMSKGPYLSSNQPDIQGYTMPNTIHNNSNSNQTKNEPKNSNQILIDEMKYNEIIRRLEALENKENTSNNIQPDNRIDNLIVQTNKLKDNIDNITNEVNELNRNRNQHSNTLQRHTSILETLQTDLDIHRTSQMKLEYSNRDFERFKENIEKDIQRINNLTRTLKDNSSSKNSSTQSELEEIKDKLETLILQRVTVSMSVWYDKMNSHIQLLEKEVASLRLQSQLTKSNQLSSTQSEHELSKEIELALSRSVPSDTLLKGVLARELNDLEVSLEDKLSSRLKNTIVAMIYDSLKNVKSDLILYVKQIAYQLGLINMDFDETTNYLSTITTTNLSNDITNESNESMNESNYLSMNQSTYSKEPPIAVKFLSMKQTLESNYLSMIQQIESISNIVSNQTEKLNNFLSIDYIIKQKEIENKLVVVNDLIQDKVNVLDSKLSNISNQMKDQSDNYINNLNNQIDSWNDKYNTSYRNYLDSCNQLDRRMKIIENVSDDIINKMKLNNTIIESYLANSSYSKKVDLVYDKLITYENVNNKLTNESNDITNRVNKIDSNISKLINEFNQLTERHLINEQSTSYQHQQIVNKMNELEVTISPMNLRINHIVNDNSSIVERLIYVEGYIGEFKGKMLSIERNQTIIEQNITIYQTNYSKDFTNLTIDVNKLQSNIADIQANYQSIYLSNNSNYTNIQAKINQLDNQTKSIDKLIIDLTEQLNKSTYQSTVVNSEMQLQINRLGLQLNNIKDLTMGFDKINNRVDRSINVDDIYNRNTDRYKFDSNINNKTDSYVDVKIDKKIDNNLENKVDNMLDRKIDGQIDTTLDRSLDNKIDSQIENKVVNKIDSKMDSQSLTPNSNTFENTTIRKTNTPISSSLNIFRPDKTDSYISLSDSVSSTNNITNALDNQISRNIKTIDSPSVSYAHSSPNISELSIIDSLSASKANISTIDSVDTLSKSTNKVDINLDSPINEYDISTSKLIDGVVDHSLDTLSKSTNKVDTNIDSPINKYDISTSKLSKPIDGLVDHSSNINHYDSDWSESSSIDVMSQHSDDSEASDSDNKTSNQLDDAKDSYQNSKVYKEITNQSDKKLDTKLDSTANESITSLDITAINDELIDPSSHKVHDINDESDWDESSSIDITNLLDASKRNIDSIDKSPSQLGINANKKMDSKVNDSFIEIDSDNDSEDSDLVINVDKVDKPTRSDDITIQQSNYSTEDHNKSTYLTSLDTSDELSPIKSDQSNKIDSRINVSTKISTITVETVSSPSNQSIATIASSTASTTGPLSIKERLRLRQEQLRQQKANNLSDSLPSPIVNQTNVITTSEETTIPIESSVKSSNKSIDQKVNVSKKQLDEVMDFEEVDDSFDF